MLISMLLSYFVKYESIFLSYIEFHKKNLKLRHQPMSNQIEMMRRDGINGGGGGLISSHDFEIM
jgi:hypothetical protein